MTIRTVRCLECGEKRAGRRKRGKTVPYREACPNCGSTDIVDVVDENE